MVVKCYIENNYRGVKMKKVILLIILSVSLVIAGCSATQQDEVKKLKIGFLPTYTVAALLVASEDSKNENGIEIELIRFGSSKEIIAALMAKQIDGIISDGLMTVQQAANKRLRIVGIARESKPGNTIFGLFGPADGAIEDIRGQEVGVGLNTQSEFALDLMMNEIGLNPADIKKVNVPELGVRMKMYTDGTLKYIISTTTYNEQVENMEDKSVLMDDSTFSQIQAYLAIRPEMYTEKNVLSLINQYNDAVNSLNENPERYRKLMDENIRVPVGSDVVKLMPVMDELRKVELDMLEEMTKWLQGKKLIDSGISIDDLISQMTWK